jgi:hypothetical protein
VPKENPASALRITAGVSDKRSIVCRCGAGRCGTRRGGRRKPMPCVSRRRSDVPEVFLHSPVGRSWWSVVDHRGPDATVGRSAWTTSPSPAPASNIATESTTQWYGRGATASQPSSRIVVFGDGLLAHDQLGAHVRGPLRRAHSQHRLFGSRRPPPAGFLRELAIARSTTTLPSLGGRRRGRRLPRRPSASLCEPPCQPAWIAR